MRIKRISLLPALGVLALTACTGFQAGSGEPPASPDMASALTTRSTLDCEPGKEHWRSPGPPKRGGVLRKVGTTPHLDVSMPGGPNLTQIPQVYGHLVKSRGCFYGDSVMESDLAKSWDVSADGRTWTFKLRDNVRWHNVPPVNGRPFTSADVAWTIDLQKRGGLLQSYWADVSHQEPDPLTVIMRLPQPDADFIEKLQQKNNVMLPREVKEQFGDFKSRAIGTGSYVLREFKPDQSTALERNPDWKEKGVDGPPLPYIGEIHALAFPDATAEVAAFRAGLLDLNSNQAFRRDDAEATAQANPKVKRYDDWAPAIWGIYFHQQKKPWDDARLRKAVALAVDAEDLIAVYRGGAVRTGPLPAAILEYAWPPEKAREKFQPDLEGAKKLLAEAGYGPGQLAFNFQIAPREVAEGEVIQKRLEAAGMNVRLDVVPTAASTTSAILLRGEYEIAWGAVSPATFFPDRWLGSAVYTGGSYNVSRMSDPELDKLSVAQAREMGKAKRKQIIDRMQDRLHEIMAYVPGLVRIYYRFYSCQMKNMKPEGDTPNLDGLAYAWLDPAGC